MVNVVNLFELTQSCLACYVFYSVFLMFNDCQLLFWGYMHQEKSAADTDLRLLTLSPCHLHSPRHLIPRATFEHATGFLLVRSTPLLEKERDFGPQALISYIRHPDPLQWTRTRTGFAAHNRPVDAREIQSVIKLQALPS